MSADLFAASARAVIEQPEPARISFEALDAEGFRRAMAEKRCEVCGGPGLFGFQSSARQGRLGLWYCGRHVQEGRKS